MYRQSLAHDYLNGDVQDTHHRLILDGMLTHFGIGVGDRVIEIGAGSGRYTEALLARGLHVTVIEPDPSLLELLRRRLGDRRELTVQQNTVGDCGDAFASAHLVCGFHVLHHLQKPELAALSAKIQTCAERADRELKGWFFLEPNPVNPLYLLQIVSSRAMRWREERGIWTNDYAILARDGRVVPRFGDVGLFPPRPWAAMLPEVLLRSGVSVSHWRSPFLCYTVYGELFSRG